MLKEHCNFQELVKDLVLGDIIQLTFDRSNINIRYVDDASKLSLKTSVYAGGNYIPAGVRHSLSHKFAFSHSAIKTFLTINEQEFEIHLNYVGDAQSLNSHQFHEIIEDFGHIAENWRQFLDEKDRNDLVYVTSKR